MHTLPNGKQISKKQFHIIFATLMLGFFLSSLDRTITLVALPAITGDLGGLDYFFWVVTAYLIGATVATPLCGKLGDMFGRKPLFQASVIIFLIGSVLSGLAQNMPMLIAFRAIQGIGAGGLIISGLVIVGDLVSARERGRYSAPITIAFVLGSSLGPLIGGLFVELLSWRWVFYVNVPFAVVAYVVVSKYLNLPIEKSKHKIDYLGATIFTITTISFVMLTSLAGTEYAWDSLEIIGLGLISVMGFIAFVWQERRATEPIIPLQIFKEKTFAIITVISFLLYFVTVGFSVYMPLYLQIVQGLSPTLSGAFLVPQVIAELILSFFIGRAVARTGRYKAATVIGAALLLLAMALLTQINQATPMLAYASITFIVGAAMGCLVPILIVVIQNTADTKTMGASISSNQMFRTVGGSVGTAALGAILFAGLDRNLPAAAREKISGQIDPQSISSFTPNLQNAIINGFSNSINIVFVVAAVVSLLIVILFLKLPEATLNQSPTNNEDKFIEHSNMQDS